MIVQGASRKVLQVIFSQIIKGSEEIFNTVFMVRGGLVCHLKSLHEP